MIELLRFLVHPATFDSGYFKREIEKYGGVYKKIGHGDHNSRLYRVFEESLLGLRIKERVIDVRETHFTQLEKILLKRNHWKVLTVLDYDGVVSSPYHTIKRKIEEILKGRNAPPQPANARWFSYLTGLSDECVVWTGRRYFSHQSSRIGSFVHTLFHPAGRHFMHFPFIDDEMISYIKNSGKGVRVVYQKTVRLDGDELFSFMRESTADIVYYVGSSHIDRALALQFLKNHPRYAYKFVFFDTGHLLF